MVCDQCGEPCQGTYCKACGEDHHRDAFATDGGSAGATDATVYECTSCGTEYIGEKLSDACPNCGQTSCRALRKPETDDGGLMRAES